MKKGIILRKVISKIPKFDEDRAYRQSISFNFNTLPAAKEWVNGKTYKIVLDVEQVSSSKDDARFEINKVGEYMEDKKDGKK